MNSRSLCSQVRHIVPVAQSVTRLKSKGKSRGSLPVVLRKPEGAAIHLAEERVRLRRSPDWKTMKQPLVTFVILGLLLTLYSCGESSDTAETSEQLSETIAGNSENRAPKLKIGEPEVSDDIKWYDYDEGIEKLTGTTKYGILYFDTTDCGPCQWMEDSLFGNPEIIRAVNKDFVAIKVQAGRNDTLHYQGQAFSESYLRKIFLLSGYPTTIFIEGATNQMVGGQASIMYPDRMLNMMGYMTSKAYKSMDFDEYVEFRKEQQSK